MHLVHHPRHGGLLHVAEAEPARQPDDHPDGDGQRPEGAATPGGGLLRGLAQGRVLERRDDGRLDRRRVLVLSREALGQRRRDRHLLDDLDGRSVPRIGRRVRIRQRLPPRQHHQPVVVLDPAVLGGRGLVLDLQRPQVQRPPKRVRAGRGPRAAAPSLRDHVEDLGAVGELLEPAVVRPRLRVAVLAGRRIGEVLGARHDRGHGDVVLLAHLVAIAILPSEQAGERGAAPAARGAAPTHLLRVLGRPDAGLGPVRAVPLVHPILIDEGLHELPGRAGPIQELAPDAPQQGLHPRVVAGPAAAEALEQALSPEHAARGEVVLRQAEDLLRCAISFDVPGAGWCRGRGGGDPRPQAVQLRVPGRDPRELDERVLRPRGPPAPGEHLGQEGERVGVLRLGRQHGLELHPRAIDLAERQEGPRLGDPRDRRDGALLGPTLHETHHGDRVSTVLQRREGGEQGRRIGTVSPR